MDFQSAISYLDDFVSYERQRTVDYIEANFDLGRLRKFLDDAGIDYSKLKYLHVGGSKGKGSVATLMANYLDEAGFKVGLFTSPHILTVRERFWLRGDYISEDDFGRYVGEVKEILVRYDAELTYFEVLFVIGLMFFLENEVDYAVLEVGLGGRLDATNIVTPEVSVLTVVEKEHVEILGDKIEDILNEKLGIKKIGAPLVVARQSDEVMSLIEKKEWNDVVFVEKVGNRETAKAALKLIREDFSEDIFAVAAEKFKLPGRFDLRNIKGKNVVFDMAHTEKSIEKLFVDLEEKFAGKEFVFLVSVMKDKQVGKILQMLAAKAKSMTFTSSNEQRGFSAVELKNYAEGEVEEDCWRAFDEMLIALKKDQVLVVTGSHFLVSKLLQQLQLHV